MTPPDAPESEDFAALLAEYDQKESRRGRGPAVGDLIKAKIVSISSEAVFVDLGGKAEGVLDRAQVTSRDGALEVAVGDEIEAHVVEAGGRSGQVVLRRQGARGAAVKGELWTNFELGIPVEGVVSGVNKGGFEVQIGTVRGFCPVSHIDRVFVEDPQVHVGQRYAFRITKYELGRGGQPDIVVSRRALLEEEQAARAAELRKTLAVGQVVRGTVTAIKEYGAFVDIGGLEGMLHVSELGFHRVKHPSEMLHVGQPLQVQVTKLDRTDDPKRPEKISLSLKALEKDPWDDLVERLPEGSKVQGKVTRFQPFGAFVEIEPGIDGLLHISHMATGKRINHPREVVDLGQTIEVTVMAIDREKRRIALSLIADAPSDEAGAADFAKVKAEARQGFGTFADLLKPTAKK